MGIGIVETTYGPAKGVELDGKNEGLTIFKGIPYAAPPVGNLRWRAPQDPEKWEEVRLFDTYGKMEIQHYSLKKDQPNPRDKMSEDCLYLNITTPAKSADEKLPVFVWFHGGGLTNGSPYEDRGDAYEPFSFAKRGHVVVSIGHRINIWGFMALPQLSAEQGGKSGNYGVMDLVKAMDWIWDNIERFGGDRNNISAGGCSGGTQKTCLLASIPAGKNRIRHITNSSGLKWRQVPFLTMKEAEEQGRQYLKYIGIDPDTTLEELRAMDSWEIHGQAPREYYPGDIIYDGDLIPERSFSELFNRYLGDVDFINVCANGESNIFATHGMSGAYGFFQGSAPVTNAETFYAFFRERLGDLYDKYDFEQLVQVKDEDAEYMATILGSMGLAQLASNNHSRNNMVNRLFGRYMKKYHPSSKVYSLFWSYASPKDGCGPVSVPNPEHRLADHGIDPRYVFDTFHFSPERLWCEKDHEYSELFGRYWSNFAKTGDVNGEDVPYWPESGEDYAYLELKDHLVVHEGIEDKLDELILEYVLDEYKIKE